MIPARLPTLEELFSENIELAFQHEKLNALLSKSPKPEWVKEHPYIAGHKYLPIDKVEYLLKKIFKKHQIEIRSQGTSFNGVYVVCRVHYLNPVSNEMMFHDGIGACSLQTKSGSSPADLANINNGALSMAYPIAKTLAVKDACDHFGRLFGADLNRKDLIPYSIDTPLLIQELKLKLAVCDDLDEVGTLWESLTPETQKILEVQQLFGDTSSKIKNQK